MASAPPSQTQASNVTELPEFAQIKQAFELQRAQALKLRKSTTAERVVKLKKLKDALLDSRQEIIDAGRKDFAKTEVEVNTTEILPMIAEINHAVSHLRSWMKPKRVWPTPLMMGTSGWIQYEPRGTSLIISPWNFPVNLSFGPLISAIAAGCTAIVKPSEMTPHFSAVITRIIRETFDPTDVTCFEGDARVAQALLDLPFDHIFFTGSPAIGKVVMSAAAKHLASVTLELGGKSPTIVDASADLDLAARNIMYGKTVNNGQICIAPDYLFVHESVKDAFVDKCREALTSYYGADAAAQQQSPNYCRIVNDRHTQRLLSLLDDARERGARVLIGGESDADARFIQPTLLDEIPADARIMEEEIFGPLLPVISYRQIDEVIDYINANPKPLALYVWGKEQRTIDRVLQETSAGGTCINHTLVHFLHGNLPFGGVNNSGIGNCHGEYGFRAFSHERAVIRTRFMLARMLFPPYNWFKLLFIKLSEKMV